MSIYDSPNAPSRADLAPEPCAPGQHYHPQSMTDGSYDPICAYCGFNAEEAAEQTGQEDPDRIGVCTEVGHGYYDLDLGCRDCAEEKEGDGRG